MMEKNQQLTFFDNTLNEKISRLERFSTAIERKMYVLKQEIDILKELQRQRGVGQSRAKKLIKIEQLQMFS